MHHRLLSSYRAEFYDNYNNLCLGIDEKKSAELLIETPGWNSDWWFIKNLFTADKNVITNKSICSYLKSNYDISHMMILVEGIIIIVEMNKIWKIHILHLERTFDRNKVLKFGYVFY